MGICGNCLPSGGSILCGRKGEGAMQSRTAGPWAADDDAACRPLESSLSP